MPNQFRNASPDVSSRIRSSLSFKLVSAVLGIYFFIAITVTFIQLSLEFSNEKERFFQEVDRVGETLSPILTEALWNLDSGQVESSVYGILGVNHDIYTVVVLDPEHEVIHQAHQKSENIKKEWSKSVPVTLFEEYIFEFPIVYQSEFGDSETLGTLTLLSNSEVIFDRAIHTFLITLFSAIIKTLVLSIIFMIILVRMVGKPLAKLTEAIESLHPRNTNQTDSAIDEGLVSRKDELGKMASTFVEMKRALTDKDTALTAYQEHLEEKIQERTVQLEQAVEAKTEFLASMSHEIRTPMNGVLGMATLLALTPLSDRQLKYVTIIQNSGTSLIDIINGILDHLRIEAGKLELDLRSFDLCELLDDCIALFMYKSRKDSVRLTSHLNFECPTNLIGDSTRIRQIIINLLGNAFKFTHTGEIRLQTTKLRMVDEQYALIRIEVIDTGCGIPEEKQSKLFSAFSQADTSTTRRYGGTGLGLTICKQLTELMHGDIGFSSEPDKGSVFWIELPIQIDQTEKKEDIYLKEAVNKMRDKTVLIVDDHDAFIEATEHVLSNAGICPVCVTNTDKAMDILRQKRVDIILLDVELPGTSGTQFAMDIKQELSDQSPPIILTSAYQHFSHEWEGGETSIKAFIEKPISNRELLLNLFSTLDIEHSQGEEKDHRIEIFSDFNILVAEDNPVNQIVISGFLNKIGIDPVIKNNGIEAIHETKANPGKYDLILLDCEMPELDGWEAAKQIRLQNYKDRHGNNVKIIALSAHAMEKYVQKAMDSGMDSYIYKPVTLDKIIDTIKNIIEGNHCE